jgi:hypothetical protein
MSRKLEEPWRRWEELKTVQEIGRRRMNALINSNRKVPEGCVSRRKMEDI